MIDTKYFKAFLIVFVFFLSPRLNFVFSQEVKKETIYEKNNRKNALMAREAVRTGNLYLAIAYLEKNYSLDASMKTVLELAPLYAATNNYPKAEEYYQKIVNSKYSKKHPEALYYLARAQKNNKKYTLANENFLKFKKRASEIDDDPIKKLYKVDLAGIEMALIEKKDSVTFVVANLGENINQPHIEFNPIAYGEDGLIYGSFPENTEKIYSMEGIESVELPKRKLFLAEKIEGEWYKMGEFRGPFNSNEADVGNGCFSLDSSRFFFTKCAPDVLGKNICKIYTTELIGSTWSKPELLSDVINMPGFTASHPTIGRESKRNYEVLYFVSDREGSKGGMDIWFSEFDTRKKAYKKARNAGSRINTVGNEMTPFYDLPTKTLYFSSNGHPSFGGLDIFKVVGETSKWLEVINIGSDINSSADDLDYALKPSGKGGYFVSNRPGGKSLYHATCCDDIYTFENTKYIDITTTICLTDEKGNLLNGKQTVLLYVQDTTGKTMIQTLTSEDNCVTFSLRPEMKYSLEGKKEGYFTNSISLQTNGMVKDQNLKQKIQMTEKPLEPVIISDIKYDFDSPNLTPRSKSIIDTTLLLLFKKYPTLQFEISSHTDSKGSDEYNLKLSQKRAESVVNYLKSKGVPERQMIPRGYGETRPIALNENSDGTDNPQGRDKNRRTEFKIIGEIEEELIDLQEENEEIEE
ncbi:MAG: OmpA family protein [Bacteroidetes bacterium]|nr:OmpA family protein [Bacteroidota bacterium]